MNNNAYVGNGDFGEQYHVASGNPYFYQMCYNKAPSDDNDYNDIILDDFNYIDDNDIHSVIILNRNTDERDDVNNVHTNKDVSEKDGNVDKDSGKSAKKGTVKLACTDNCKPLTDSQIKTIKDLKEAFGEPVNKF